MVLGTVVPGLKSLDFQSNASMLDLEQQCSCED